MATWPAPLELTSRLLGSAEGDAYLVAAILEWGHASALRGFEGFWDAPFFFPEPRIIAYSEHLLGILPLYLPFRMATGDPLLAYNATYLVEFALCGYGAFLLARHLTRNVPASFLAGALFEVLPFKVYNADHLQCLALGFVPLCLLCFQRQLEGGRARDAILGALAFTLTFLSGFYNGIFLGTLLPPFLLLAAWGDRRRMRRLLGAGAALAAALAVLLAIHLPMLRNQRAHALVRTVEENAASSARPTDYLRAPAGSLASRVPLPFPDPNADWPAGKRVAYLGLLPTLLAVVGALAMRTSPRGIAVHAAVATMAFVLSLGPRLVITQRIEDTPFVPMPYLLLFRHVPGYDAMRTPVRLAAIFAALLVPVVASGAARLLPRRAGAAWAMALLLVVVHRLECWPLRYYPARPVRDVAADAGYRDLASLPRGAALFEVPADWRSNAISMWAAAQHGHPTVNGWTGFELAFHQRLFDRATDFPSTATIDMLLGLGAPGPGVARVIWRREAAAAAAFDRARAEGRHSPRAPLLADHGDLLVFGLRPWDELLAPAAAGLPPDVPWTPVPLDRLAVRARRFTAERGTLAFASAGRATFTVPLAAGTAAIEVACRATGGADPLPPMKLRLAVEGREVHEELLPWERPATVRSPALEVRHAGAYEFTLFVEPSGPVSRRVPVGVEVGAVRVATR